MSSPEAPEVDAVATDAEREQIVADLRDRLGDALVGFHIRPGDDLWVRVTRDVWQEAGMIARDHLGFRAFEFVSAIDWLPSPFGKGEDSSLDPIPQVAGDIVTGYAGGDTRFQVFARAHSLSQHMGITLKVDLPDDDLSVATWIPVFAGANWHEREAREMFGITFVGHPHPVNIYLPGQFEGHPLRKDFPLLSRHVKPWPGIVDIEPLPGGSSEPSSEEGEA